jgi:hypothetical protein
MKYATDKVEVGGFTVTCPILVNTKSIAAGDILYVKLK